MNVGSDIVQQDKTKRLQSNNSSHFRKIVSVHSMNALIIIGALISSKVVITQLSWIIFILPLSSVFPQSEGGGDQDMTLSQCQLEVL